MLWLPSFLKELSWLSPRHLWSIGCLSCYLYSWWLQILLFHTIILSNAIKPLPQVGSELGETSGRHVSVLRKLPDRSGQANTVICGGALLCSLWNQSPGLNPGMQAMCGAVCEPGRWVARASKNGTKLFCFPSCLLFLIQHSHGCCKTLFLESWQFILTISAFIFFLEVGRFGAVHSTI